MTDALLIVNEITPLIYILRGHRAMLDSDLAVLYGVETRALNQAVRRNRERFPGDFMFHLTRKEISRISHSVTSSDRRKRLKYSRSVSAFTEQGVSMLSSVLRSSQAIQVNIAIMRAFVKLREVLTTHKEWVNRLDSIDQRLASHDGLLEGQAAEIKAVFQVIRQLMEPRKRKPGIGFKPQDS